MHHSPGSPSVIEVVVVAVAALGAAAFRYLTARVFVKHADRKDLPAIARAVYQRYQLGRGQPPDQEASPQDGEPDRGT
jgi:hypothetical protein